MGDYNKIKTYIEQLFDKWDIPKPNLIRKSFSSDICDVTNPPIEIRIDASQECSDDYHATHLFGHYIADLHGINNGAYSELIADTISDMILRNNRL